MTEFDIQESFFRRFKLLNEISGKPYLRQDSDGYYTNVHFPNVPFAEPDDARWFDLSFVSNEPEPAALTENAQNRFTGVFYVDIITPLDVGESEAMSKKRWLDRIFSSDIYFDDVVVQRCYVAKKGAEDGHYRVLVAVDWTADIDKE